MPVSPLPEGLDVDLETNIIGNGEGVPIDVDSVEQEEDISSSPLKELLQEDLIDDVKLLLIPTDEELKQLLQSPIVELSSTTQGS